MTRNLAITLLVAFVAAAVAPSALADAAAGKDLFIKTNCNSCHGLAGAGDGPLAAVLNPPPRNFTVGDFKFDANGDGTVGTDEDLLLVIKNGAQKYGGNAMMAPNPTLSDDQIKTLITFVRSVKK
jgi:mono/diheme cytochrome c family protein